MSTQNHIIIILFTPPLTPPSSFHFSACSNLSKTACDASGTVCHWCEYSDVCTDYVVTCPLCSVNNGQPDCCNAAPGCGYCYSSGTCKKKSELPCVTCPTHTSDCSSFAGDCLTCSIDNTCHYPSAPCATCSQFNSSVCGTKNGCGWCASTGQCQTTGTCKSCSTYGLGTCPTAGCHYCNSDTSCKNISTPCATCANWNNQESGCASLSAGDCAWCKSSKMCVSAAPYVCVACGSKTTNATCSALPGCKFCGDMNNCINSTEACAACSDFGTTNCPASQCTYCQAYKACRGKSLSCPPCADLNRTICNSYLGCSYCSPQWSCNNFGTTCTACNSMGSTMCTSAAGCCANHNGDAGSFSSCTVRYINGTCQPGKISLHPFFCTPLLLLFRTHTSFFPSPSSHRG